MKKVNLTINGRARQVVAKPDLVLLDLLRKGYGLTGTKQSCDRKGQCGACTVIVNKTAVRSCLAKVVDLDDADIITVEGLGTPDNPHLIQEAFVLSGAIQCGFCTPGMIMATKALLDANPNPTAAQIKHALRRNLCRCTGYVKIIAAVKLAARFLRGEITPDDIRPDPDAPKLGISHPRPSAFPKACGTASFSADIMIPGAIELALVASTHAHALINHIDTSKAEAMPGVIGVLTAKDIKGTNRLKLALADRPVLCDKKVRYIGDPVAVVAAETRSQALAAVKAVRVDYQPLPVLASPGEALAEGAVQVHDEWPNLCSVQPVIKGDAQKALAESANVIEARFTTQCVHQSPLEPETCLAFLEGEGEDAQLVIIGRSIQIHTHTAMIQDALGWENLRYEEAYSGGQFGIKIEVTTEAMAAAAALHFKRPVRFIPNLWESMYVAPKRHPFDMKVKMGADAEGRLTALDIDMLVDNGAYISNGVMVVFRALLMMCSSYHFPNVNGLGRLVYTNNPWGSAARGAGPPQANFAVECAIDMLAEKVGIDPLEFRERNSLLPGQSTAVGDAVQQWPFPELCKAIKPHYQRAIKEAAEFKKGPIRRGVGFGTGAFGIGTPGDKATVVVELDPDDGVTIYAAVADPGEGNDSMLTQLAAHTLDLPLDKVRLMTRSTALTSQTGPAAGSRMTYMAGGAMVNALNELKKAMTETGATSYKELKEAGRPVRYMGNKKVLQDNVRDQKTGQGPSYESQVHAVQMAEVEVNLETGQVRMLKMTTAVDAGTVINPLNLEGQLEGGMDMGAGFALREQYIAGKTKDWVTFKYPTMKTAFDVEVIVRETPRLHGTEGATGIGEMTMVPTAPAVINAINHACGARVFNLPATPDKVKAALA